jgi:formylglycine-generating enzyme required for sulfatase activity
MALTGLVQDPANEGYWWVKPLQVPCFIALDLLEASAEALVQVGGDLSKLEKTLIPEGGIAFSAGAFTMGSPPQEWGHNEFEIERKVEIEQPFVLGKYPVTQGLYQVVEGKNPADFSELSKANRHPVEMVSWYDAVRFCNELSQQLGLDKAYTIQEHSTSPIVWLDKKKNGFRLPTGAEWEYAARDEGKAKSPWVSDWLDEQRKTANALVYPGRDDVEAIAWYGQNSGGTTHPVGLKKPTGKGLYDMAGNVSEWVHDSVGTGSHRILRGGGHSSHPADLRCASQQSLHPGNRFSTTGFRLCRTISEKK